MGLNRDQIMGILAEVVENNKRLNACAGPHDFQEVPGERRWARNKYRCIKCQGTVDATAWLWYTRGLAHGKGTDAE